MWGGLKAGAAHGADAEGSKDSRLITACIACVPEECEVQLLVALMKG